MSEYEDRIKASPAAKRRAEELGIDIYKVKGTGSDGRIQLSDVENYKPAEIMQAADELTEDDFSDITLTVDRLAIGEDDEDDDFFDLRTPPQKSAKEDEPIFAFDAIGDGLKEERRAPAIFTERAAEKPTEFDFSEVKNAKPTEFDFSEPAAKPTEQMKASLNETPAIKQAEAAQKPTAATSEKTPSKPIRKSIFDILADDEEEAPSIVIPVQKKPQPQTPQQEDKGFGTPFVHDKEAEQPKSVSSEGYKLTEELLKKEEEINAQPETEEAPTTQETPEEKHAEEQYPQEEIAEVCETAEEREEEQEEATEQKCEEHTHEHTHEHGDECECEECCDECGDEDYDDEEDEVQPLHISFKVKCANIDEELDKYGLSVNSALLDSVMKALAYAIHDSDEEYDGRINVVNMDREGINVRTAADTLNEQIGKIVLDDPSDYDDDIFVNVWDMTNFGFSGYNRPDPGMLNVFLTMREGKVKVEMLIDEYAVDLYTATIIAEDFRLNLNRLSLVAERKSE